LLAAQAGLSIICTRPIDIGLEITGYEIFQLREPEFHGRVSSNRKLVGFRRDRDPNASFGAVCCGVSVENNPVRFNGRSVGVSEYYVPQLYQWGVFPTRNVLRENFPIKIRQA
jgi:hypothetical protein